MKLIEGFDSNYRYILVAARRARDRREDSERFQVPDVLRGDAGLARQVDRSRRPAPGCARAIDRRHRSGSAPAPCLV